MATDRAGFPFSRSNFSSDFIAKLPRNDQGEGKNMILSSLPSRVISSGHCLWSKSGGEPAPRPAEVSTTAWGE